MIKTVLVVKFINYKNNAFIILKVLANLCASSCGNT